LNIVFKVPLLMIFISGIFATYLAPLFNEGIFYFIGTILVPIGIFVTLTNIKIKYSKMILFIHLIILSGIVLSLYSIYLVFVIGSINVRLSSIWADVNIVAAYYMIIFFILFTFIVHKENNVQLVSYVILLIPVSLALFATQSRNAWLALVISLTLYVIRKPRAVLPTIVVIGIFLSQFYSIILDRFLSIKYFSSDMSSLGRIQAWFASVIIIKDHLLFGSGFNAFDFMKNAVFDNYIIDLPHSHNTYLRLLLELGLFGFIPYISFFFLALLYSFKLKNKIGTDKRYLKVIEALQLSFVGLTLSFMFEPYFSTYGNSTIIIWIMIAFTFNLYHFHKFGTEHV
jgi:O-antigen ligase